MIDAVCEEKSPMVFNAVGEIEGDFAELSSLELEMYQVIDDIDTYSDMAKDNLKLYQNLVMKRIQEFHDKKLTVSDGYHVHKKLGKE